MAGLTAKEIKQFDQIADSTPVTMLVVADDTDYPILYGSNMNLLGYSDSEIRGKPLGQLLPEEVREMHPTWMEGFKTKALGGEALGMAEGKIIPGVTKLGQRKNIKIDIDYIARQRRPYFLGFLQPEGENYVNLLPLYNLKTKIDGVMDAVEKEFRRRIQAAGGGVTGVFLAAMGIFTPVWPALQSAWKAGAAAFNSPQTSSVSGPLTVTAKLDKKQRNIRLNKIRDELGRFDDEVVAVAYYEVEQSFSSFKVNWDSDTDARDNPKSRAGKEVWFYESSRGDRRLTFSALEAQALLNHDCIMKIDGASMPTMPGHPLLDVILCPTYKEEKIGDLVYTQVAGVLAVAYHKQYSPQGVYIPLGLEPRASNLWRLNQSAEKVSGE